MSHFVNFFITGFIIWIFEQIGWIQIQADMAPSENPFLNQLILAGIVGLIFTVGRWLTDLVFLAVIIGSCGLGCLLFPLYYAFVGPIGFWVVMQLLPGWITLNASTVQIIIMGILLAFIRFSGSSIISVRSSFRQS